MDRFLIIGCVPVSEQVTNQQQSRCGLTPMLANSQRSGLRMGVRMRELQMITNWCELRITITERHRSAALRCAGELLIRRSEQLAAKWGANVRIHMVCELVRIANYQHSEQVTNQQQSRCGLTPLSSLWILQAALEMYEVGLERCTSALRQDWY